jgi:hypothetical protein
MNRKRCLEKGAVVVVGNGVSVRPSSLQTMHGINAGNGLFADRPFAVDECITEYEGQEIEKDTAKALRKIHFKYTSHCRAAGDGIVIDGYRDPLLAVGHGGASFANDGAMWGLNNSELVNIRDPMLKHRTRIFLVATRNIMPGDEIFVSYGTGYWEGYASCSTEDPPELQPSERNLRALARRKT